MFLRRGPVTYDFNPRPPRGGRLAITLSIVFLILGFQSTPPARGATMLWLKNLPPYRRFQSTPPARGATPMMLFQTLILLISIHAPREGGDGGGCLRPWYTPNFNPRPPRGGRQLQTAPQQPSPRHFNPRPPRGGRLCFALVIRLIKDFNPRPPRGGRPSTVKSLTGSKLISIHAPREGGDQFHTCSKGQGKRFQSTPPARGATYWNLSG